MKWFAGMFAALSSWAMAVMMFRSWWWPMNVDGGRWVKFGVAIMAMEAILVTAGIAFGAVRWSSQPILPTERPEKTQGIVLTVILVAFYSVFGLGIVGTFHDWTLFAVFSSIMLSRLLNATAGPADARGAGIFLGPVVSVVLLIIILYLVTILSVPAGGITPQILDEVYRNRGVGQWEREPQRPLAAGALYFFMLGFLELLLARRKSLNMSASRGAFPFS